MSKAPLKVGEVVVSVAVGSRASFIGEVVNIVEVDFCDGHGKLLCTSVTYDVKDVDGKVWSRTKDELTGVEIP